MHGGPMPVPGPEPGRCRYRQRMRMAVFASDSPLAFIGPRHGLLLLPGPSTSQQVDDVEVVLVAGVFVHLLGRIDLGPGNPGGPRPRPGRRILDSELVVDRAGVDARKAFGDVVGRG